MHPPILILALATAGATEDPSQLQLESPQLTIGVAAGGSLIRGDASVGIRFDPDGSGSIPLGGDWLTPGEDFDVFTLEWTDTSGETHRLVDRAPRGDSDFALEWTRRQTYLFDVLEGAGEVGPCLLAIRLWLPEDQATLGVDLHCTLLESVSDLSFTRIFDPDPDYGFTASYETHNTTTGGLAAAEGDLDGRSMVLMADPDPSAGQCSVRWCERAEELVAAESSEDIPIGVTSQLGSGAAGDELEARFVYAFAMDTETAQTMADTWLNTADLDEDGSVGQQDCDPLDPDTHPGSPERADGIDQDCDGEVDEGTGDDDGDGLSEAGGDCDDTDPSVQTGCAGGETGLVNEDGELVTKSPAPAGCAHQNAPAHKSTLALLFLGLLRRWRTPRSYVGSSR